MNFSFKPDANHIQRILNSLLIVNSITLRNYLKQPPIHGYKHCLGRFKNPLNVVASDFTGLPSPACYSHNPARVDSVDMAPAYACPRFMYFPAAHHLGGLDGL